MKQKTQKKFIRMGGGINKAWYLTLGGWLLTFVMLLAWAACMPVAAAELPITEPEPEQNQSQDQDQDQDQEQETEPSPEVVPYEYSEFPTLRITTENSAAITSKEEYLACVVSVENADDGVNNYNFTEQSAKIRGRGNSTWKADKKPYKLKFDQKIDLFGNGKAKTWTLIANDYDPSMVRNYLAYSLAALFASQQYTTSVQFVDLVLNDVYQGVYLVCEQVQTGTNRVDIADNMEKYSPEEIGYLLELDDHIFGEGGVEGVDYVVVEDVSYAYVLKTPDPDDGDTTPYAAYIKEYLETCVAALSSQDWSTIQEYLDVTSFAESYVFNELFKTVDVFHTSFYLYKPDHGGKLFCGPVWDYDISVGNCNYVTTVPDALYVQCNFWYEHLLQCSEFVDLVQEVVLQYYDIVEQQLNTLVDEILAQKDSFERNFTVWPILGVERWPSPAELVAITDWSEHVLYVQTWLQNSWQFIYQTYAA